MKKYYFIYFIWVSIFLAACGTVQDNSKPFEELITIPDVNSWLNLMPGSKGSFHISGEYSFRAKDIKFNPTLNRVEILIGQEFIYSVLPKVKNKFNEDDVNRNRDNTIVQYFTNPGLNIDERLLSTDKINLKFVFEVNGNEIEKLIADIELTRAY